MSVLAIAHRAGNSLAALEAARELGADVVECDVHAHRGRLEVRHLKTAGPLPFLWDRWELVPASVARLELHALLAARRELTLMLDLKGRHRHMANAVAELLDAEAQSGSILVCGRWWPAVDDLAGLHPHVRPVLSARNRGELARLRTRLRTEAAPYGVSVHVSLLDVDVVEDLRAHVSLVMTWPVNDMHTLDRVWDYGVTGVISDENDVLAEVLRRRGDARHERL